MQITTPKRKLMKKDSGKENLKNDNSEKTSGWDNSINEQIERTMLKRKRLKND